MVYSELGWGTNVHISLILSPDMYNIISLMLLIRSLHPPVHLVIPTGTTQFIVAEIQYTTQIID